MQSSCLAKLKTGIPYIAANLIAVLVPPVISDVSSKVLEPQGVQQIRNFEGLVT